MSRESSVIIGAGPAGLTAAYELGKRGMTSTVLEASDQVGEFQRPSIIAGTGSTSAGTGSFPKSLSSMNCGTKSSEKSFCSVRASRASTTTSIFSITRSSR